MKRRDSMPATVKDSLPVAEPDRPQHVERTSNGRTVCVVCFNVQPNDGVWRMRCRRKPQSVFMGG